MAAICITILTKIELPCRCGSSQELCNCKLVSLSPNNRCCSRGSLIRLFCIPSLLVETSPKFILIDAQLEKLRSACKLSILRRGPQFESVNISRIKAIYSRWCIYLHGSHHYFALKSCWTTELHLKIRKNTDLAIYWVSTFCSFPNWLILQLARQPW